jgi:hypothetical protein
VSEEEEKEAPPEKADRPVKLELKDYVALTVAALETFLLPLVVLIFVLGVIALFFAIRP